MDGRQLDGPEPVKYFHLLSIGISLQPSVVADHGVNTPNVLCDGPDLSYIDAFAPSDNAISEALMIFISDSGGI